MAGRRGGVVVPISTEFNSRGLQQANKQLTMFGKTVNKSFANIGATIGGAFALGAVTDQIGQMVSAASDLAESQSKVGVVFGSSAKDVQAWSETAVKSMGMTQQAALEAAGTYGNLFQAFGIGRDQATKMSTTLVQLASDLASFNNTSMDEAITALRSGLSGETEPLKRYGVALTDVRLRQEALNMGIYDGKGVLSAAQKAQASYALILKDTSLAQGDFARTADGAANTMKSLTAAYQQSQAIVGGALLRSIMDLGDALGGKDNAVDGMTKLATGLSQVIDQSASGVKAIQSIYEALRDQSGASKEGSIQQELWNQAFDATVQTTKNIFGGPLYSLGGIYDNLGTKTNEAATASNRYARDLQRQGASARTASEDNGILATTTDVLAKQTVKAKTALERLKAQMDRMQGRSSVKRQRLDLQDLLANGPDKSGERKVVGADGKQKVVNYSTERDKKRFALDVADARRELGLSIYNLRGEQGKSAAAKQFALGRQNLAGLGLGNYVKGLLNTPAELRPGTFQQRVVAGQIGGKATEINYNFAGDIVVQSAAQAVEEGKRMARLAALSGSRYAGMASTGRGYRP